MNHSSFTLLAQTEIALSDRYSQIRQLSEWICQPLATEDYVIQSMADVSPPKWHLAHTSWFFETFLLVPHLPGYEVFHPQFGYLFNSYYEAVGQRHPRPQRGLLSRPTVAEIYQYRAYVDQAMRSLLAQSLSPDITSLVILGLHHEQQHQELLLMDIKHILALNPLRPAYRSDLSVIHQSVTDQSVNVPSVHSSAVHQERWLDYPGGLYAIGQDTADAIGQDTATPEPTFHHFSFDNESPRHATYLQDYYLASRLVTNGEYLEFIQAGGYSQPEFWLSEGWNTVQTEQWQAPLYWEQCDGQWWIMTLSGLQPLNPHEPVCHVSFFEADAYARWARHRLPTEAEWEVAAGQVLAQAPAMVLAASNLLAKGLLHPAPAQGVTRPDQLFGDVWEWTQSAYSPYPGFRAAEGAIGEYNGKFMCNQMVLRGGCCITPPDHIRPTYRNFFPPAARWQFSGIRLSQM